jgi:hypothetical protein
MDLGLPAGKGVIVLFMAERYSIIYLSPQKTEEKSFVKKFVMHPNLTKSTDESAHQTVTEFIKLQTPDETIQIGFTDQKVSGRAGLLTFARFLHWHRFGEL